MFKQEMARLSLECKERAESAEMIAASRSLRARGGDVDEDIESEEDRDEHVEFDLRGERNESFDLFVTNGIVEYRVLCAILL